MLLPSLFSLPIIHLDMPSTEMESMPTTNYSFLLIWDLLICASDNGQHHSGSKILICWYIIFEQQQSGENALQSHIDRKSLCRFFWAAAHFHTLLVKYNDPYRALKLAWKSEPLCLNLDRYILLNDAYDILPYLANFANRALIDIRKIS